MLKSRILAANENARYLLSKSDRFWLCFAASMCFPSGGLSDIFNVLQYKSRYAKSSGVMLLDLTMVMPLLLLIFIGSCEFSMLFKTQQLNSVMSREITNIVYRDCVLANQVAAPCVTDVLLRYQSFVDGAMPGATVILSVYQYNSATLRVDQLATGKYPAGSSKLSRFTPTPTLVDFQTQVSSISAENPTLVIGEMYFDYSQKVKSSYAKFVTDTEIYDATIF